MPPFRIVAVDDSALFRTLLRNVIADIPDCELVECIADSSLAAERIAALQPDLVTLDVEMPLVNGIEVLRELKRRRVPVNVIMISRFTTKGAQVTTDALIEGAFDFIVKPATGNPSQTRAQLLAELTQRIDALRETSRPSKPPALQTPPSPSPRRLEFGPTNWGAVIIGCSTGGPDALARIVPELPAHLPVPIIIVQHMPERFTASLASRLDEASQLRVAEAQDGMLLQAGQVLIAKGGSHLAFQRTHSERIVVELNSDPHECSCRPSVDYTLRSAFNAFQKPLIAAILTGMGRDGTLGCQLIREHGGYILAQDAPGCTVFGMPKAVIQSGAADEVVSLENIPNAIIRLFHTRTNRT